MEKISSSTYLKMNLLSHSSFNFAIALSVFIGHILLNFLLIKPNPALDALLQQYTLSPPPWVFSIWLIIWLLQAVLFYKTYHTSFWSTYSMVVFVLMCGGNVGSQFAGANNLGWPVYIGCIVGMLIGAVLFMQRAEDFSQQAPLIRYATQVYVGWASIAMVVGSGTVLIYVLKVIGNAQYAGVGYGLLVLVPLLIWTQWWRGAADYRGISFPYFWVLLAFVLRFLLR